MVQFGMKTEPNQTKLFVKFKIIELNRIICISNWTELFQTKLNYFELNRTVIIGTIEGKKSNFSYRTELNYSELNRTVSNGTKLFWAELNCFSSVSELLVIVQFFFGSVQQFSLVFSVFFSPLGIRRWEEE